MKVVQIEGDMGEGRRLQLLRDNDGDIIISIVSAGHRFSLESIEFCVPGYGGGRSPKTFEALRQLLTAMEEEGRVV